MTDYTRTNKTIEPDPETDKEGSSRAYLSVNKAKKASRKLQAKGHKVSRG